MRHSFIDSIEFKQRASSIERYVISLDVWDVIPLGWKVTVPGNMKLGGHSLGDPKLEVPSAFSSTREWLARSPVVGARALKGSRFDKKWASGHLRLGCGIYLWSGSGCGLERRLPKQPIRRAIRLRVSAVGSMTKAAYVMPQKLSDRQIE